MKTLREEAIELYLNDVVNKGGAVKSEIAKKLFEKAKKKEEFDTKWDTFRRKVSYWIDTYLDSDNDDPVIEKVTKVKKTKKETSEAQPFILSAWDDNSGDVLNIDQYCERYNMPRGNVRSYKLVTHTGTPYYNIQFKEQIEESEFFPYDEIKSILESELDKVVTIEPVKHKARQCVVKIADTHLGAVIEGLLKTRDYNTDILRGFLRKIASDVNALGFEVVHVHIHGDLIESFSGLNHINSWMSMNPQLIGARAIRVCSEMLHSDFLSLIKGLGEVYIVAGNHDRTSKNNDEDVKGGAADLIAYALELLGYSVHFHSMVLTHKVDGINYVILHGDKVISKRSTKDIIWDYGTQGCFNFVAEGHLHSVIEKLSVTQRSKFEIIKDDFCDHRRMHLPSLFTGNFYSESLSFYANPGYIIVWDNGNGLPNIFNGTL